MKVLSDGFESWPDLPSCRACPNLALELEPGLEASVYVPQLGPVDHVAVVALPGEWAPVDHPVGESERAGDGVARVPASLVG